MTGQKKNPADVLAKELRSVAAPASSSLIRGGSVSRSFFFWMGLIVLFGGALAGLAAGAWSAKILSSASTLGAASLPTPTSRAISETSPVEPPSELRENLSAGGVGIYRDPGKSDVAAASLFLTGGVPLTSDGWVASPDGAFMEEGDRVGVVWNRRWYPVEQTVRDPLTGIVFFKVRASGFPLTPFSRSESLQRGDLLIGYDHSGAFTRVSVASVRMVEAPDAVHSSERIDAFPRIDEVPSGMPMFNARGELVGMSLGGEKLLPAKFIEDALKMILKEGKVRRPFFGAAYKDRSSEIFVQAPLVGALLVSSKEMPAVARSSPLSKAGLKEGDVVIAVENTELNQNQTLAEVVAGFAPGTKVSVKYFRGGKEETANVTLGER